jgi:hypothetical protein
MRPRSILALGFTALLLSAQPAQTRSVLGSKQVRSAQVDSSGSIEAFRSGDNVIQSDKTGKGAVLCVWGIYQAAKAVGAECHKGADAAFQSELERSLNRIDEFIVANSKHPVTRKDLETRRIEGLRQLRSSGNICVGDAAKLYNALHDSGAAALQAQTTDLLSIPREPVMNPCL